MNKAENQNITLSIGSIHSKIGLHIHKEKKPLESYPNKIIARVQKIWNHIKEAWCSGKQDQFEYIQKWISHVVSGRKMRTCLYLTSVQGIGKSIIIKFLAEQVLGLLLFVLEEAPCASANEWKVLTDKLKNFY